MVLGQEREVGCVGRITFLQATGPSHLPKELKPTPRSSGQPGGQRKSSGGHGLGLEWAEPYRGSFCKREIHLCI